MMDLPSWIPERLARCKDSLASSPHRERFEALLTSEDMAHVWPTLEKKAKDSKETPGQKDPLEMYLIACTADQWMSAGHANEDLEQLAKIHNDAADSLESYVNSIERLERGKWGNSEKSALFCNMLLSASRLGVDTSDLDNLSEPEFFPILGEKLQDLVRFHRAYAEAIRDVMKGDLSKDGSKKTERRILAVKRTLKRCTRKYFQGPCHPQIVSTVNVIAEHLGLPKNCKIGDLTHAKR